MTSAKRLSVAQRKECYQMSKGGSSSTTIARHFKCSRDVVARWVQEGTKPRPQWGDARRSGRPPALQGAQRQKARRAALRAPSATKVAATLTKDLGQNISAAQVRAAVKAGRAPLAWQPRQHGRRLSEPNRALRVTFSERHLTTKPGTLLFSDSKLFYLYHDGSGAPQWRWQRADGKPSAATWPRGSNPIVMHFYAVVGKGFKSDLFFTAPSPSKGSKDKTCGEKFCSSHFIEVAKSMRAAIVSAGRGGARWRLVLDHAKPHTSKASTAALTTMGMNLLEDFPPQSWDINIIENMWAQLTNTLEGMGGPYPRTPDGWAARIRAAWDSIPQSSIDKRVSSFPQRLQQIIAKKGAWLAEHK